MDMQKLFVGECDTDTHRVCGTCGKSKPLSAFYKDGKDAQGNVRYRRDCKECYKKARLEAEKLKESWKYKHID